MTAISTAAMSRTEWLKERTKGIGGSDVATVLGLNPYKDAEAAAAKGLEAYQEYFMTKLNNEERGELTRSGNHDRLKKAAANHQPTE